MLRDVGLNLVKQLRHYNGSRAFGYVSAHLYFRKACVAVDELLDDLLELSFGEALFPFLDQFINNVNQSISCQSVVSIQSLGSISDGFDNSVRVLSAGCDTNEFLVLS